MAVAEELRPYMKSGLHYRIADVLYRNVFGPIVNVLDRLEGYFTRRWVERELRDLSEKLDN